MLGQKTKAHDYATLSVHTEDSRSVRAVSTPLLSSVTLNNARVGVHADFDESAVTVVGSEACASGESTLREQTALPFIFNDDTLSDPVRSAEYVIDVQRNCSASQQTGIVLGMRTTSSPLWRIWTYASFSRNEIRLGRAHPKNSGAMRGWNNDTHAVRHVRCAANKDEYFCRVHNVHVHGLHGYTLDFHSDSEKVYVPQRVFLHYTGFANEHCVNNTQLLSTRDIGSDWPPFVVHHNGSELLRLEARLFVPKAYEDEFSAPDASEGALAFCEYASMLVRTAGVLSVSSDDTTILVGTGVLRDYTLGRDYLHSTLTLRSMKLDDHFSFFEMLMVLYIFTLYLGYKSESMTTFASYAIGVPPLCTLCHKPMIDSCARHVSWKMRVANHVSVLSVFALAWYSVLASSKVGVGYNEAVLVAWSLIVLGTCTLEYTLCNARKLFFLLPKKRVKRWLSVYGEQMYDVSLATSVECACTVALFSLTSVVRTDDLSSLLSVAIALLVVYDGFRRLFLDVTMLAVSVTYNNRAISTLFVLRTLVVSVALNVAFTAYAMGTHVVYVALNSATFTAIAGLFCAHTALSITLAYVRRAMVSHVIAARAHE